VNLAQAVLLYAYELRRTALEAGASAPAPAPAGATDAEIGRWRTRCGPRCAPAASWRVRSGTRCATWSRR
jgi:hypothetical protein